LLRAMETAGKQIEDEELKEALKENGIGRPSTRAAIIETLFKRAYIRKEKKKILPTTMGIDLIGVIKNPTLKSPELTGQWEKKLRQIEAGSFPADAFLRELKQLVLEMAQEVKADRKTMQIEAKPAPAATATPPPKASKASPNTATKSVKVSTGDIGICPVCKTGKVVKGAQAFGCTRWKENCLFRLPIACKNKLLTEKQVSTLLDKGKVNLKGLKDAATEAAYEGLLTLNAQCQLEVEKTDKAPKTSAVLICPRCNQGQMLKGKAAFGCSRYREGCQFLVPFTIAGKVLTDKNIAQLLLKGKTTKLKGFVSQKTGNSFEAS